MVVVDVVVLVVAVVVTARVDERDAVLVVVAPLSATHAGNESIRTATRTRQPR